MYRVPGNKLGKICMVEHIPEGSLEIPFMCAPVLECLESRIDVIVSDVKRKVTEKSLQYETADGKVFLKIRFKEKSMRLIFPGNTLTFVDEHRLTKELPVAEWGDSNMEYELKDIEKVKIAEEYIVTSLTINDYYTPAEREDDDNDDEYTLELTDGKYDGPVIDGKPHGIGKFTWTDGSTYEGSFINGYVSGNGKYTRANGDVFEGVFVTGKFGVEKKKAEKEEKKPSAPGDLTFTFGYIF